MGKIFYIMGKSASGKDTIYRRLLEDRRLSLRTLVPYTTRPMRSGEQNGREYFFTDEAGLAELERAGKVIERRCYLTACGPWNYFTVDDGQVDLANCNYLMVGTLESFRALRAYYGDGAAEPVYIDIDDGLRLQRALDRERAQDSPKYTELCRRFLADTEDFSEEKLARAGVTRRFDNTVLEDCLEEIRAFIRQA
ncbi:MAG: guanylate kinase [Eubacteriales bacterium]|nr:guanylate kinase [Eubacteriales bacterium]